MSGLLEVYKDAKVLVTGGSGFLGKVLIEKLLRSTQVNTIYMILRPKHGLSPQTRTQQIFDSPIFSEVKKRGDDWERRVVVLEGDMTREGLGLSREAVSRLEDEVSLVFHVAATVSFNQSLPSATSINVLGTLHLLQLAQRIRHLKACVIVSTAYANSHMKAIKEKIYPVNHITCSSLLNIVENIDSETADLITSGILRESKNTYVFTKRMAECLVESFKGKIPVSIFRPAIVMASWKEPVGGWVDNLYGPNGLMVGVMTGLVHTVHLSYDSLADVIPVDTTCNALIASAYDTFHRYGGEEGDVRLTEEMEVPVYNYTSSNEAPITWGRLQEHLNNEICKESSTPLYWYPFVFQTNYILLHRFYALIFHYIPAYISDAILSLLGQKPRLLKLYKKHERMTDTMDYFCNQEWRFENGNVRKLWSKLNEEERKEFMFDLKGIDWAAFIVGNVHGIRRYLLGDPKSQSQLSRYWLLHQFTLLVIFLLISCVIFMTYKYFSII